MKKLIVAVLLMAFFVLPISARTQQFKVLEDPKPELKAVDITVEGQIVKAYITEDENYFQIKVAQTTGKPYRTYLGYKTNYTYSYGTKIKNEAVYTNKQKDKFWGLMFTNTGTIKKVALDKFD